MDPRLTVQLQRLDPSGTRHAEEGRIAALDSLRRGKRFTALVAFQRLRYSRTNRNELIFIPSCGEAGVHASPGEENRLNAISRRRFLAAAAMSIAATRLRGQSSAQARLTIPREANGPHMPDDYIGLSYEVQQLVAPSFFSAENARLIHEFRALSTHGVLRLGGNTSEFEWWKPTLDMAQYYPVTAEAVRNLAGFLRATGWTCLK